MPPGLPQVQLVIWSMVLLAGPAMFVPITRIAKYQHMTFYPGTLARTSNALDPVTGRSAA